MILFDTHLHYNLSPLLEDWKTYHHRAVSAGLLHAIVVGTTDKTSAIAVEMAKEIPELFASIGVHPNDQPDENWEKATTEIERLYEHNQSEKNLIVAIGEIGLDYARIQHHPDPDQEKTRQKNLFNHQLRFAQSINLPVILHCRDAHQDLFQLLNEVDPTKNMRLIFHCMSGTEQELDTALEFDSYISFAGNITYPKSTELRTLVQKTPINRILAETDAPYLPPQEFRGKTNYPEYVRYTIELIAELKQQSVEEMSQRVHQNALECFRIQP